MKKIQSLDIFVLFFLSGMSGLIYEIAWGRLFVLTFGATTNSIVAVVSAFLGGLAIGSFLASRIVDRISQQSLLKVYAGLEVGVGLFALLSIVLIPQTRNIYGLFSDGTSVTTALLIIKFLLSALVILIPTTLMGATLPTLVKYLTHSNQLTEKNVSLLYGINTLGAVLGVVVSAFILIELVGINLTILIGVLINLIIGLRANSLATTPVKFSESSKSEIKSSQKLSSFTVLVNLAFFGSGLISIAYQILWTRALTPSLGTVIYAFGSILVIYLLGLAGGSLIYQRLIKSFKSPVLFFGLLQSGIGLTATASVLITHKFQLEALPELLIRVLPPTILLGLTFPAVVGLLKTKLPIGQSVGISYFSNTLGTILGGFLASFILIPYFGTSQSIVLLAFFNILIGLIFICLTRQKALITLTTLISLIFLFTLTLRSDRLYPLKIDFQIADAKMRGMDYQFSEDEVATVFAINDTKNKELHLIIDGVETTHKTIETRLMAHIPVALHPNPQRALVIAFGMGTSYKSFLKHDLVVDAVELVPSVPKAMHLFHPDSDFYLNNPQGRVIINDGRNYAFLTHQHYDIAIIDPPPPFNTAGSTVLHSEEFYQDLLPKMNKNGIVSQWIYYDRSRVDEISMAIKAFVEVFPNVLAVQYLYNNGGLFLEGSLDPIKASNLPKLYQDPVSLKDLADITQLPEEKIEAGVPVEVVGDRQALLKTVAEYPPITDNNPRSEYYLLRHNFSLSPTLVQTRALEFINKIKYYYHPS